MLTIRELTEAIENACEEKLDWEHCLTQGFDNHYQLTMYTSEDQQVRIMVLGEDGE